MVVNSEKTCAQPDRDLAVIRSLSPLAHEPGPPGLVILFGLPGSGKSHFGRLLSERCGTVVLNSDHCRRAIVEGVPCYDAAENRRLFKALNSRVEELLDQGQVVVLDSTALRDWIRQPLERIARERGLTPIRIHLDPPEDVIFDRLADRQPPPDPVDEIKTWRDVYEWMLPGWQPIAEPHLHLVNPESVYSAVDTVRRLLAK